VGVRVVAVAAELREVDAADERDLVVDDHELLVVAMERARARVARGLDLRPVRELVARRADRAAIGGERVRRRARPHQHADVDALGRVGEELAQHDRRLVAGKREVGRDRPAGDVHVPARAADRVLDLGERLRAVDQHVDRVARPRRRVAGGPERPVGGRVVAALVAEVAQPPAVVRGHRTFDDGAGEAVGLVESRVHHRFATRLRARQSPR
jgi:hypothetical protein